MPDTPVRLESNGDYWKAAWTNSHGRTVSESIGPKKKIAKRQALQICRRLAAKHIVTPGLRDGRKAPTLKAWGTRYMDNRTDVGDGTRTMHTKTLDYLYFFFGEDMRIDRITKAGANDWRAWLVKPSGQDKRGPTRQGATPKGLNEQTVCTHARNVKVIFNHALREDAIVFNPFGHLVSHPPEPDKDWPAVTDEQVRRMIDAAPSMGWKALIGLCVWAGLRRGEALRLEWLDVQWERKRLVIRNPERVTTTKKRMRECLLTDELARLLLDAHEVRTGLVVVDVSSHENLHGTIKKIIRAAGLEPWSRPFHTLRKARATSWEDQGYPSHVVDAWLGHGMEVARKHYRKVDERHYTGTSPMDELAKARKLIEDLQKQVEQTKAQNPPNSPQTSENVP